MSAKYGWFLNLFEWKFSTTHSSDFGNVVADDGVKEDLFPLETTEISELNADRAVQFDVVLNSGSTEENINKHTNVVNDSHQTSASESLANMKSSFYDSHPIIINSDTAELDNFTKIEKSTISFKQAATSPNTTTIPSTVSTYNGSLSTETRSDSINITVTAAKDISISTTIRPRESTKVPEQDNKVDEASRSNLTHQKRQ